ncbi:PQQ-binding-like beta-propeller repeat protein [Planctomycetota bacterium]
MIYQWLRFLAFAISGIHLLGLSSHAGDWPQWRYDSGHTSASPDKLPNELSLAWTRTYSPRVQVWDDPLNHDLMPYDRIFEPVVKDGRMFVGFNNADKVVALDTRTGGELWTFYTDGPVRFAPVVWKDSVLFTSDDGCLYSIAAASGELQWKFRGGPSEQKVIGNRRIISAWPARGGPVVHHGDVYFAASIWPFMGTFIYSLDAESGEVNWVNDSTSAQYIKQPHSAPSFAGVAPQGQMVVTEDTLLVPGGRSVPAAFDRQTGAFKYFDINEGGKGNGGSLVLAKGKKFYVHTRERGVRSYKIGNGKKEAFQTNEPVLSELVYSYQTVKPKKKDDDDEKDSKDKKPEEKEYTAIRAHDSEHNLVWELKGVDASGDIVKAGDRLYVVGGGTLTALQLNDDDATAKIAWRQSVPGDIVRLLAGDDRLFAVTLDGKIMAFDESKARATRLSEKKKTLQDWGDSKTADQLLELSKMPGGIILWYGLHDKQTLRHLLLKSDCQIIAVDEDQGKVDRLRAELDAAGFYGTRISIHQGTVDSFEPPPYVANLVVVSGRMADAVATDHDLMRKAYGAVRPYGGCLVAFERIPEFTKALTDTKLEKSLVVERGDLVIARRVGALPGAADWTHQYGDVANTVKSDDSRVKLPLGLLWFGGSSNMDVLPRHGHGPPEQVIGGRLYIQGMNSLNCRDVYTGRVIWNRNFKDLGTYDIYYDETYKDTPLDPAYNQVHIPGANGRGTNYVATEDAIYLVVGNSCYVLDVWTGDTINTITLPEEVGGKDREWGYIGVYNDVLIGGVGFANFRKQHDLSFEEADDKLSGNSKGYGSKSIDRSASRGLVGFNRHTGEVLWRLDAQFGFLHNAIVAGDGRIYCLDKLPKPIEDKLKRRGQVEPDSYRVFSIKYRTGELVWENVGGVFGTWLGYSEDFGLLLQAGAAASDRLKSEIGQGMAVYEGATGEVRWRVDKREYSGPCILHNDSILTNANSYQLSSGAYSLLDGTPKLILNPLTNTEQPWKISRAYGCNSIIASENLLTFRSGAAGYYDMNTMSGTGNLGGFKSGCTSNLIVANGVLNAPDYTRTCSCAYQNQTSLALVHMPEMDMWTVNHTARLTKRGERIKKLGVNFGAPGDRTDERGTLWLDYPTVGGESAVIEIKTSDAPSYYHHHTLKFSGPETPWIGASGIEDATEITVPMQVKPAPDGLRFYPRDSNDDAEESPNGSVNFGSSDLELTKDEEQQIVGIRFADVEIPQSTKIIKAYIQFTADEKNEEKTKLKIQVQDVGNAVSFQTSEHNISSRALREKKIKWEPKKWDKEGRAEGDERTPDLTELVQAIVNRDDWKQGNAMAFVITGEGKRVAKSRQDNEKVAPQLVVEAEIPKDPKPEDLVQRKHTVRLYFAEPNADAKPGDRIFNIELAGKPVTNELDITAESSGARKTIVREYNNIAFAKSLTIKLTPINGKPVLSGVEIVRHEESKVD